MSTTTIGSTKVESNSQKGIVYLIALIAALGGLLFGLDQGFVANALSTISAHYNLSLRCFCFIKTLILSRFLSIIDNKDEFWRRILFNIAVQL